MRFSQTCSKCSGKVFAVIAKLQLPRDILPLPAVTLDNGGEKKTLGTIEAWLCLGCGYTEFYARELAGIDTLARVFPEQVRIVDARPPEQGPYR